MSDSVNHAGRGLSEITEGARAVDASPHRWDAVVVGAGPAGAVVARQLARGGARTLLVEAKRFPRAKVCGGCLNPRVVAALERIGLGDLPALKVGLPLRVTELRSPRARLSVELPSGIAVSREPFDNDLVHAAVAAGAVFLPETTAVVGPLAADGCERTVRLSNQRSAWEIRAAVVVCADGLARISTRDLPEFATVTGTNALIGAGALCHMSGDEDLAAGEVLMAIGTGGYVGVVRVEGNQLNLAAAVRPARVRECGGLSATVRAILTECQGAIPVGYSSAEWHGTPPLTSAPRNVAGERIFLIGDAAGYVEPITGEGVAFAIESAIAAAELACEGIKGWSPALAYRWRQQHSAIVRQRQRMCRYLSTLLRYPRGLDLGLRLGAWFPQVTRAIISRMATVERLALSEG